METISERFSLMLKALNLSNNAFAKSINKTSTTINYIIDGRNKPSFDVFEAIFKTYKTINPAWLLTGEGEMLVKVKDERRPDEYLQAHLRKLEENFQQLNQQIEVKDQQIAAKDKQLSAKDSQIEQLLGLLGKPECATETGVIKHPAVVGMFLETLGQRA